MACNRACRRVRSSGARFARCARVAIQISLTSLTVFTSVGSGRRRRYIRWCRRPTETAMEELGRGFCGTVPMVTGRWTVGKWRVWWRWSWWWSIETLIVIMTSTTLSLVIFARGAGVLVVVVEAWWAHGAVVRSWGGEVAYVTAHTLRARVVVVIVLACWARFTVRGARCSILAHITVHAGRRRIAIAIHHACRAGCATRTPAPVCMPASQFV